MSHLPENDLSICECWHANSGPYIDWQLDQFRPFLGQRVADVGCALGHFTERLKDRELYLGLEPDTLLANKVAEKYATFPSVKIIAGENADITRKESLEMLTSHHPDTVLSINVLEHIENDRLAITHMTAALRPGNFLCLLVPAMPSAFGPIDRSVLHYRRYSKKMLTNLLTGLPLEIVKLYPLNLIGGIGWFVKNRILKAAVYQAGDFKTINRLLPFIRFFEDRIHPPFGLSLILVAKKVTA